MSDEKKDIERLFISEEDHPKQNPDGSWTHVFRPYDPEQELERLRAENAVFREALQECNNEIAQSILESGEPIDRLPVEHLRLALVNIAGRIQRVLGAKEVQHE